MHGTVPGDGVHLAVKIDSAGRRNKTLDLRGSCDELKRAMISSVSFSLCHTHRALVTLDIVGAIPSEPQIYRSLPCDN